MSEGSELFLKHILPDESHEGINREVWSGTPWVVNAYTGQTSDDPGRNRDRQMCLWCDDHFGEQAWPFGKERGASRPGRWFRGCATVFGWTWFGFDTEEAMNEFAAAWPAPAPE